MGIPASPQTAPTPSALSIVAREAPPPPPLPATTGAEAAAVPPPPNPGATSEFRQRAARASLVHAVMCRYAGAADFFEVTTLNISQSGMLFHGETLPAIGSELEFKFILENGFELLSGTAKVMRHAVAPNGSPAAGVAFGLMEPPVQRILARVIEIHSEIARS